jgi:sec-independent protein translocase protein TatB
VFNLAGSEIVVILLLALVVLGPEKLPDAIRRAGRIYSELKKMGNNFQSEMRSVLDEPMQEMRETADLIRKSTDFTADEPSPRPTRRNSIVPATAEEGDEKIVEDAVDDDDVVLADEKIDDDDELDDDERLINRTPSGDTGPEQPTT